MKMPAKWFKCPDDQTIEITRCLMPGGCRMSSRCATLSYLELVGFDREWQGVSPSAAGNGPRYLYLKAVKDYAIDPQDRAWAALGTSVHGKVSIHKYNRHVLAEEPLSDEEMKGTADALEADEQEPGSFVLTDLKVWGSFKVAKALGVVQVDKPVLDDKGEPVLLKSGKNKGQPKTEKETVIDPAKADLLDVAFQLNRYRIFFERAGFPISRMQIMAIPRDGNTYIAKSRGIDKNLYLIPVPFMSDTEVLVFYHNLQAQVDTAFAAGYVNKCNSWESWEGRKCNGYCEVAEQCEAMGE
jgi:hypothetical protein